MISLDWSQGNDSSIWINVAQQGKAAGIDEICCTINANKIYTLCIQASFVKRAVEKNYCIFEDESIVIVVNGRCIIFSEYYDSFFKNIPAYPVNIFKKEHNNICFISDYNTAIVIFGMDSAFLRRFDDEIINIELRYDDIIVVTLLDRLGNHYLYSLDCIELLRRQATEI